MDRSEKAILIVFLVLIVLGLCLAVTCGLSLRFTDLGKEIISDVQSTLDSTADWVEPTEVISTPAPRSTPTTPHTFSDTPEQTLAALQGTTIPEADWIQLSEQFYGITLSSEQMIHPAPQYHNGDEAQFWVMDGDTNENQQVTATLRYQTDHVYFWVENGVQYDKVALKKAVETFSNKIYETDREFFGSERNPGIDDDSHVYILYSTGIGDNVAGYTSFSDSYPQQIQQYSNQHEMFYLNAENQDLADTYVMDVMAHEFQHLIHEDHDGNEQLWLNEGFSELAVYLNGYNPGGFDELFAMDPDINLTEWPNDDSATSAHYGSSFLFTLYLLDRFGEDTTKAVVANTDNGMQSIDEVLAQNNATDSLTGKPVTADDVFQDWVVANYLDNPSLADGRYGYANYSGVPDFTSAAVSEVCGSGTIDGDVNQYGTDYYAFTCSQPYEIVIDGAPTAPVLSEYPLEGSHYVWSNMDDMSITQMTKTFDFTVLSGNIDFIYHTWFDIEQDYDFAYLLASTDEGQTWQMLDTPSCTTNNTTGNNFGCGYNGSSDGWLTEDVDISQFAGQKVMLRFEYVTDEGVTGEGMVIDQISVPQLGYETGFESDDGGWDLVGFSRIENQLPQTFLVSLISGSGNQTTVEKYQVSDGQPLTLTIDGAGVTVVISGTSRFTRQPAEYQIETDFNQ
jgi:hypothetical protein